MTIRHSPEAIARANGNTNQSSGHESSAEGVAWGPDGITTRWVFVTPEIAYEWLENQADNRTLSPKHAAKFIRDLGQGRWLPNPQGVGKDTNGHIIDGQHRLYAIFESGIGAWLLVTENLPPETQRVVDDNRKRSFSDDLKIESEPDYSQMAAMVALVARVEDAWERSLKFSTMRTQPYSRAELHERIESMEGRANLHRACRLGMRAYSNVNNLNGSAVAALYYLVSVHGAGSEAASIFIESVISEYGHYPGDPEVALRNKAKLWMKHVATGGSRPDNNLVLAHCVVAYSRWARNKPLQRVEFKTDKRPTPEFPKVYPKLDREL